MCVGERFGILLRHGALACLAWASAPANNRSRNQESVFMIVRPQVIALSALLALVTSLAAWADRVEQPVPLKGQSLTYQIKGTGAGALDLYGAANGLPFTVDSAVRIVRRVTDVAPDGSVTTVQKMQGLHVAVEDQPLSLSDPPDLTMTTDASGKVLMMSTAGQSTPGLGFLSDVQSALQQFQLPNGSFRPGDTATVTITVPGSAAGNAPSTASMLDTYIGLKTIGAQQAMEFRRQLKAPVSMKPAIEKSVGGFTLAEVIVKSADQTADYSLHSGALIQSVTRLKAELKLRMGQRKTAIVMTARLPIEVDTNLIKTEGPAEPAGTGSSNSAQPGPPTGAPGPAPIQPGSPATGAGEAHGKDGQVAPLPAPPF
jgi:hypothetical protein